MRLPIPSRTPDNFGETLFKLIQLSGMVNNSDDHVIIIDLSNTKFLHCIFLSGLFALIKAWREKGKEVIIENISKEIEVYIQAIHFEQGFDLQNNPDLIHGLVNYNSKRFIPIVCFPLLGDSRETCINTLMNVIHAQTGIAGVFRQSVDFFIAELTNNIADHSEAKYGIIMAQSYKSKGFIDVVIADNGIGVLTSYDKSEKFSPKDEAEAIQMAISGNSTKDLPESRGFGLSNSRNVIVNAMTGTFLLWSGETLFIEKDKVKHILKVDDGAFYNGCFLALRLPLTPNISFDFYRYIE